MTISIHALLAESDRRPDNHQQRHHISIHALLAESDGTLLGVVLIQQVFLSTLSLRRATACIGGIVDNVGFLSTLSLRRATRPPRSTLTAAIDFYPRSPCGERHFEITITDIDFNFYPRSPCGERRIIAVGVGVAAAISIHALLAESDHAIKPSPRSIEISIHALLAESD